MQDDQKTSLSQSTHLDTYWEKESRPPQNNLTPFCEERGQWRAGSPGRKRRLSLRTGASGIGVVRPYTQQSGKTIGEVTDRADRKNKNNKS